MYFILWKCLLSLSQIVTGSETGLLFFPAFNIGGNLGEKVTGISLCVGGKAAN